MSRVLVVSSLVSLNRGRRLRLGLIATLIAAWGLCVAGAAGAERECWEGVTPAGALPGQPEPVFCSIDGQGPGTSQAVPNRFRDAFDHGLSFADFEGTAYSIFNSVDGSLFDSVHWRHADHWMVDVAPVAPDSPWGPTLGGSMLSPSGTYTFQNGKLAIETAFAAGHEDYLDSAAWGEIIVTTAAAPTTFREGGSLYGYDTFPGHYTLGCRLQADRTPICALMDDSERGTLLGGRIWEMSFFQLVGESSRGGYPGQYEPEVWRVCKSGVDPDTECRDLFRLELTATSLTLFVNGKPYFQQLGIPDLPTELTQGELHVYVASMIGRSDYEVIRFHWDELTVNARR